MPVKTRSMVKREKELKVEEVEEVVEVIEEDNESVYSEEEEEELVFEPYLVPNVECNHCFCNIR